MHAKGSGATYGQCADCRKRTRLTSLRANGGTCRTCRAVEYVAREEDRDARELLTRAFLAVIDAPERGTVARANGRGAIGYARVSRTDDAHAGGYHYASLVRMSHIDRSRTMPRMPMRTAQDLSAGVKIRRGRGTCILRTHLARKYGASPSQGDNAARARIRTWDVTRALAP